MAVLPCERCVQRGRAVFLLHVDPTGKIVTAYTCFKETGILCSNGFAV